MELRLVRDAFDHADYVFELKHDGIVARRALSTFCTGIGGHFFGKVEPYR